jgi:hypothetical protein
MKIVNGKWQDTNGDPVTVFSYDKVKEIGNNLVNLYGEDITYSRINLISTIKQLTPKQEDDLAYVLSHEGGIAKIAGFSLWLGIY